jgi:hypothetical protein
MIAESKAYMARGRKEWFNNSVDQVNTLDSK